MFYTKNLKTRGNKGLTLIEALIATVTVTILLAGALVMQLSVRKSYYAVSGQNEVQKNVEEMMGDITDGLRETRGISICNSTTPADRGDGTAVSLCFYEGSTGNLISYRLDSSKLRRGRRPDGGSWNAADDDEKVADYNDKVDIDSFALIAYQEDGTTTTTEPRDIRTIEINLTAHQTVAPTIAPGGEIAVTLYSTVDLRKEPLGNITGSVTSPASGVIIAATGAANFLYTVDSASNNFSFFATPSGTNYNLVARSLMYDNTIPPAVSLDKPGETNTTAIGALPLTTTKCRISGNFDATNTTQPAGYPFYETVGAYEGLVVDLPGCTGGSSYSGNTFYLWGKLIQVDMTDGPALTLVTLEVKKQSDDSVVDSDTHLTTVLGAATFTFADLRLFSYPNPLLGNFVAGVSAFQDDGGYQLEASTLCNTSDANKKYDLIELFVTTGDYKIMFILDPTTYSTQPPSTIYYLQAQGGGVRKDISITPGKDNTISYDYDG